MFDFLKSPDSVTEAILYWRWAAEHPYLFAAIKIGQPAVILGAAVAVGKAAVKIVRK